MKIYEIIFESDSFQTLYEKTPDLANLDISPLGESRHSIWPARLELVTKPRTPRGIFHQWGAGEFVLTREAQEDHVLVSLLEVDGEFLPVIVDADPLLLHNITCFSDCVDRKRSRFDPGTPGVPAQLLFPYFDVARVPLGIHFRLREYPRARYVATDLSLPPDKDFYQWYHQQGYKGLKFRLQWDSEQPDELICFY